MKDRLHVFRENVRYSFVPRKPSYMLRLIRRSAQGIVLKRMTSRQVEIALDYSCNLNCSHCSSSRLRQTDRELMTADDYRNLYRQLKRMGIVSIILTGGEPLFFFEKLLEIIDVFQPRENLISIQSNTLLLTPEKAGTLYRRGVDFILGSVDTFHEGDSNTVNFERVDTTIDMIRSAGMNLTWCTVVTHENIHSDLIVELIERMAERRCMLFFNVAIPVGEWAGCDSIRLIPEDMLRLRELTRKYPNTRFDFASNFGGFGCPAFKERTYITPYGDVNGCPFIQVSFGNVKNGGQLPEIRKRAMRIGYFDHYHHLCLAGEDREFMDVYLPKYEAAAALPIPAEDIFPAGEADSNPSPGTALPHDRDETCCDYCGSWESEPYTGLLVDDEGQDSLPPAFRDLRFQFVRCSSCGLVYLGERPNPEDLEIFYSVDYKCFQDFEKRGLIMDRLARVLAGSKLKQISKLMPPGNDTLLDYGCGSGTWLALLKNLGCNYRMIGTDIFDAQMESMRRRGIEAYRCDEDSLFDHIEPGSVGVIHLFHVIEHVPYPMNVLTRLKQALVPGGVIIGQTPNVASIGRRFWKDMWNQWHIPRHCVVFSRDTLRRHARAAGLEVVKISNSLSGATQWSASLTKWIAGMRGRNFRGTEEPLYPPLILAFLPLTVMESLLSQTCHMDFIFRRPSDG